MRGLLIISLLSLVSAVYGQVDDPMIYTRSFTNKLRQHRIDFYQPVERWLHIADTQEDEYMEYDAVLHDEAELEIRIRLIPDEKAYSRAPHIEVMRTIAHISTNDPEADIRVSQINHRWVVENYNADWALYADFKPKEAFSAYPKGRILCIYREGRALIQYIILHDEEELDPYFEMPLSFID